MQNKTLSRKYRLGALGAGMAVTSLMLAGCGAMQTVVSTPLAVSGPTLQGKVHGGQQPVSGSTIQLYVASTTGYGNSSYALLATPVTSDANGGFNITSDYTCPSSSSLVYITATGGNPGTTAVNPNLAMMSALGACGSLNASTYISINELTTVGSVYALAQFMSSYARLGTSAANVQGLTNAFGTVNKLVNIATGQVPGAALPAGATVPTTELNTLADILASCINSTGGYAGDSAGTMCGALFTNATPPGGSAPTDTIGALINIAKNPSRNVSSLIALASATAPFQPTLPSATDFSVAIKHTGGAFNTPSAAAVDTGGNLWVTNAGNNTLSVLGPAGAPVPGSPYSGGGLSAPSAIALDASGNAWVTDKGSSQLSVFTAAGTGTQTSATGLNAPTAIAIDGQGLIWVTNQGGSGSVTAVSATGTTVTGATSYSTGGVNAPVAVAINPH